MVPTTLIGRLAVSSTVKGQGFDEVLLMDALWRIWCHGKELGSAGAVVDAADADAIGFYKKYGFLELSGVFPKRLFLPMSTIEQMLS